MRPAPLYERIPNALRLGPMTAAQLARCLGVRHSSASRLLRELADNASVTATRTEPPRTMHRVDGRPPLLYAATHHQGSPA